MKQRKAGSPITLYHFCAAHTLQSILDSGLTLGCTPIWEDGKLRVEEKTQWLTLDGASSRQSWDTRIVLPYSRTAYRLTIVIPYNHRKKLIRAPDFMAQFPGEENQSLIEGWAGSECWYIFRFRGIIPPAWIVGHKRTGEQP